MVHDRVNQAFSLISKTVFGGDEIPTNLFRRGPSQKNGARPWLKPYGACIGTHIFIPQATQGSARPLLS